MARNFVRILDGMSREELTDLDKHEEILDSFLTRHKEGSEDDTSLISAIRERGVELARFFAKPIWCFHLHASHILTRYHDLFRKNVADAERLSTLRIQVENLSVIVKERQDSLKLVLQQAVSFQQVATKPPRLNTRVRCFARSF